MQTVSLSLSEIQQLVRSTFEQAGCDEANVASLVRTISSAEADGSHSHGLFRVPGYVASLKSAKANGTASPKVKRTSPSVVKADGDGGFTPLAIERGMPALIDAATETGFAALAIANTYHFAALWPETEMLAHAGLAGLACTSSIATVAPAGGSAPLFGTNPISFAWPRPGKAPYVFDMATSAMAHGDLQIAARDGRMVSDGVGLDKAGKPTNDPQAILEGVMLPFGGYKGSAIAMMVELFAGGLIGEQFSFEAAQSDNRDGGPARGGELIMAFSPDRFAGSNWPERCEHLFERIESMEGVRMPGSRRHHSRRDGEKRAVNKELYERILTLSAGPAI